MTAAVAAEEVRRTSVAAVAVEAEVYMPAGKLAAAEVPTGTAIAERREQEKVGAVAE